MPKTKARKAEDLVGLSEAVKQPLLVFATFTKMKVSDDQVLRRLCQKSAVAYTVVKKTLLKKALTEAGLPMDVSGSVGNLALATSDESLSAAKEIFAFSKKNDGLQIVGGIFEGKFLSPAEIKVLATVPSRTELYGQLVGTLANPLRNTVGLFSGVLRNFVGVLNAMASK